jgi:hypothetical protein
VRTSRPQAGLFAMKIGKPVAEVMLNTPSHQSNKTNKKIVIIRAVKNH